MPGTYEGGPRWHAPIARIEQDLDRKITHPSGSGHRRSVALRRHPSRCRACDRPLNGRRILQRTSGISGPASTSMRRVSSEFWRGHVPSNGTCCDPWLGHRIPGGRHE